MHAVLRGIEARDLTEFRRQSNRERQANVAQTDDRDVFKCMFALGDLGVEIEVLMVFSGSCRSRFYKGVHSQHSKVNLCILSVTYRLIRS